jgi:putative NADH-flavin reductase
VQVENDTGEDVMARITVLGGTGYAGSNIVREAAARGHQVTSYSRHAPEQEVAGVTHVSADVSHPDTHDRVVAGADVVVVALSPRGDLETTLRGISAAVAAKAQQAGVRLGVVGGAGSLFVTEGGIKVIDAEWFPEAIKPEARTMEDVLEDLRASDQGLDWFYVSPAGGFGAWAVGEPTGTYRTGGDVLLADAEGNSFISGADFGTAVVDEIETPAHRRQRFTVAY